MSQSTIEHYLVGVAVLLILSVTIGKATARIGIPSLLVFLALGMLAGSEGVGGVYFDNAAQAQTLGVIALAYILFSGGLDTDLKTVRPLIWHGTLLATVGILVTCFLVGAFARYVLAFSWLEGLLLGAIVSSTDAAAVFTVLREKNVVLRGQIRPLLELESGSNDPMAVLLTVEILELMTKPELAPWTLVTGLVQQIALGGLIGVLTGKFLARFLNHLELAFEGLYPVVTMAFVILIYGATQIVGGSGFLAVYLCGLVLGGERFVNKQSLMLFHDGMAWLMQIFMFVVLGLLVFPSRLSPVMGKGVLVAAFLILVARPTAVFLALARTSFKNNEKAMMAWVGLRGSVPIILATYPYLAGIEKADMIFHLVFFVVLASILIQGSSISVVGRWLRVS